MTVYLHEGASTAAGHPVLLLSQTADPSAGMTKLERTDLACEVPPTGPATCQCSAPLSGDDQSALARILARIRQRRVVPQPAMMALNESGAGVQERNTLLAPTASVLRTGDITETVTEFGRLAEEVAEKGGVTLTEAYRELARRAPQAYNEYCKAVDSKTVHIVDSSEHPYGMALTEIDSTGPGDDAVNEFTRLVRERMQNDSLDVAAATRAVAIEFPGVYQQYRTASTTPDIPMGLRGVN
jgi:hypothetical protein